MKNLVHLGLLLIPLSVGSMKINACGDPETSPTPSSTPDTATPTAAPTAPPSSSDYTDNFLVSQVNAYD
ncbi:MAG: hypothetical protein ACKO6N_24370 [Myxococcota bacterium]